MMLTLRSIRWKGIKPIKTFYNRFVEDAQLNCKLATLWKKNLNTCGDDNDLKEVMKRKIKEHRELVIKFRKEHAKTKLGDATVGMIYGGMRGLAAMLCETSALDPNEGIRFRNLTIPEVCCKLPKGKGCNNQPYPEGLFWLFCTGDIPTIDQVNFVRMEWICRAELPQFVIDLLLGLPKQVHPMAQLSAALSVMSVCSEFPKKYNTVKKDVMWELMYEDCMDLLAKIISVASIIYTHTYKECGYKPIIDEKACWTKNFCISMGYEEDAFIDFMRLYMILHSDHGSGNVSAHTVHLVGSALSDCYLAMAAGINGLAGPLHGLANQEVWKFVLELQKKVGKTPTDDQVKTFVQEKLKTGVVPGYGHAVLRKTDPRFTAQKEFCEKNLPNDPGVKIVWQLFKIVPPLLQSLGKVQNPWPNVDAHSGAILQAFKMTEMNFYTVLFAVSRALGTMAWLIWARALLLPIERPKSYTTAELMKMVGTSKDKCEDKKQSEDKCEDKKQTEDKCEDKKEPEVCKSKTKRECLKSEADTCKDKK
ncbi:hypothetical protein L9F63_020612 [Diploptera punctata]|uniref:Citrate synthase n=1 Tax=Diploptera punctata TaxID=6984 RepID=A0AAD7ZSH9_DIPPU|nr:hypothetical protein L9F63_020612 [Diploptera punctata]